MLGISVQDPEVISIWRDGTSHAFQFGTLLKILVSIISLISAIRF